MTQTTLLQPSNEPKDIWYGTSGPKDAEIVIVGEAWGAEEAATGKPLLGSSGTEFDRMLAEAGLDRTKCLVTSVIASRPASGETWRFLHSKEEGQPRVGGISPRPELVSEVRRLYAQIHSHPRRLVIALGNYALWALTNEAGSAVLRQSNGRPIAKEIAPYVPDSIMSWRGSMWYMLEDRFATVPKYSKTPLLPIIHPTTILKAWDTRAVTVHDLKARVPMALKGDWRHRNPPVFLAPPTFEQCCNRLKLWIGNADRGTIIELAEDIETARGFITCLGLADSVNFAMSIPFIRKDGSGGFVSWWTIEQETEIVRLLRILNSHPNVRIVGQNFIYDTQYIQFWMAVIPKLDFDTMLAQNVMFPGTPKALDYLSSLFCKYHWYWKEDHKEWNLSGTIEDLLVYNCWDNVRTFEIAQSQRAVLKQIGMEPQMAFKMRVNDLCLRMMNRGILVDRTKRSSMLMELNTALQDTYRELEQIIPQEMVSPDNKTPWYRSSKQQNYLFYDALGFRTIQNRKTGNPTVGKEALMELKKRHPEFSGLFNRLDVAGSVANTATVIQSPIDSDFRMRCSYNPGGTETHRLSSSKSAFGTGTNLQNLSKGEED